MKKIFVLFLLLFCFISSQVFSQTAREVTHSKMLEKLASLTGNWKGYLEYLDYSDGKTKVQLPTELNAVYNKSGSDKYLSVKLIYDEGKGRSVTGEDAWTILDDETFFYDSTDCRILNFDAAEDKTVFKFERSGEDNDKPCIMLFTFTIESDKFSILKQVLKENDTNYFVRHKYVFERIVK